MTVKWHVAVKPTSSTAVYVTLVLPMCSPSPGLTLDSKVTCFPLSVAEGSVQLLRPVGNRGSVVIWMSDGQWLITGGVLSRKQMLEGFLLHIV